MSYGVTAVYATGSDGMSHADEGCRSRFMKEPEKYLSAG